MRNKLQIIDDCFQKQQAVPSINTAEREFILTCMEEMRKSDMAEIRIERMDYIREVVNSMNTQQGKVVWRCRYNLGGVVYQKGFQENSKTVTGIPPEHHNHFILEHYFPGRGWENVLVIENIDREGSFVNNVYLWIIRYGFELCRQSTEGILKGKEKNVVDPEHPINKAAKAKLEFDLEKEYLLSETQDAFIKKVLAHLEKKFASDGWYQLQMFKKNARMENPYYGYMRHKPGQIEPEEVKPQDELVARVLQQEEPDLGVRGLLKEISQKLTQLYELEKGDTNEFNYGDPVKIKVFSNWSEGIYIGFDVEKKQHIAKDNLGYILSGKEIIKKP